MQSDSSRMVKITVKILPAASLALTLLLTGCPVPVVMDVAKNDVQGQVLDKSTGSPVPDALIVQTISRGGFWSTPATYDLGHAISDNDGTFRIPATPRRVFDASDPDAGPQFGIFAAGYNPAWFFFRTRCATLRYTGPNQSIGFGGTSLPHCKSLLPCALYLAHVPAHPQAPEFTGEHTLLTSSPS
jgi:hypothetical protein